MKLTHDPNLTLSAGFYWGVCISRDWLNPKKIHSRASAVVRFRGESPCLSYSIEGELSAPDELHIVERLEPPVMTHPAESVTGGPVLTPDEMATASTGFCGQRG